MVRATEETFLGVDALVVRGGDLDALDAALGELRAAGSGRLCQEPDHW
jgi:hypothetical protein